MQLFGILTAFAIPTIYTDGALLQFSMPNTTLGEAAPTAYLGFAQLLERLRPKRSYAAGFTTPLRLNSAQVAQYKYPMPQVNLVCLLMYYFDFTTYPIPLDGIIS